MTKDSINTVEDLLAYIRGHSDNSSKAAIEHWVNYWAGLKYSEGLREGRFEIQNKIISALGLDTIIDGLRDDIYTTNNPV